MFGNYHGQPPQRPQRERVRFNFMLDRMLYLQVKEDAKHRNITMGAWVEQAIAHQLNAMQDLPTIELLLESKLLEILMHRNASRRQSSSETHSDY